MDENYSSNEGLPYQGFISTSLAALTLLAWIVNPSCERNSTTSLDDRIEDVTPANEPERNNLVDALGQYQLEETQITVPNSVFYIIDNTYNAN